MAYPTGSGSERLNRGSIVAATNSNSFFEWSGTSSAPGTTTGVVPALHIITLLGVVITEVSNAARTFNLIMVDGGTTESVKICNDQAIGAKETFVWNDRLVLTAGDKIYFIGNASSNYHIWYSFIDQDWT